MAGAIVIGERSALALRRYWSAVLDAESMGSTTSRQREEIRSYAVEALMALHVENPGALCDAEYIAGMDQLRRDRGRAA